MNAHIPFPGSVAPVAADPAGPRPSRLRASLRAKLPLVAIALVLVAGGVFVVRRMLTRPAAVATLVTETVTLHDISQSVDATGAVEAVEVVEIKSKASGQIIRMPVAIGSVVKAGDLLAQIDPLTVRNQYNQSLAALEAAQSGVTITTAQKQRADELYSREAMTAMDHESAQLGAANALASLARARADLQIAKQALDDATVRAPAAGTIIEQIATKGMVITSGTSSASGGTSLFKTADLNHIQLQALVGETDIGNLEPGMSARVTVDAFPNHSFQGQVVKIEPQAVVQQSVTMFPVLVAIENENGKLLPGMNGQVTIDIARRTQVVAVPLDAVRTLRELPAVAALLGLDADSVRAQVQRQTSTRGALPVAGAPDTARMRRRGAGQAGVNRPFSTGGNAIAGGRTGAGAGSRGGGSGARASFVMVRGARGLEPRAVRLGISDFDYAEVLSGVQVGDAVVLLSVAEQAAKRTQQKAQAAQRAGTGLPGSGSAGGGGGSRAGGGR